MAGGLTQSSSSSGIFFQGDGESQGLINSHLSSSYGNSTNSGPVSGPGYNNLSVVSGEMNNAVLNSVSTSGPSVGASSLVTDANSALSGGPQLQRSASINAESYMRLPASPMSFSSNNISISGSSVVDGSTVVQQSSQQDPSVQQGGSSATSLPTPQNGQVPLSMGPRVSGPFFHDPNNITQAQKKPRMDIKQDDVLQQQVLRQWLQRQDVLQLQQSQNPQFQLLLQQQRLRQQQQLLQSLPPLQRAQLQQQQQQQQQQHQQQLQMRQQLQPQGMQQQVSGVKRPYESSVCARRLMQYLYHQRQRPSDNNIIYWRKFVAEYYSPRAKKRWCLSLYDSVGHHALGVFPQMAVDAWQCDICGSKSGRGFDSQAWYPLQEEGNMLSERKNIEATFEVLPRLNEIKFASGVLDELLFLDVPRECRFPSGIMMLEFGKAVQESVYEHLRVVREGQLRIIFSQELKILSWEFCARCHEEFLPRRLVAPQVNQLLQVAQKCQSTISESGSDGVSQQDLQANSNMVLTAGRQLAKSLELHSLNDLGFSKRYVRCLQISEVVNSMKDLIDFCRDQRIGPIEGLKSYPRHMSTAKLQMQKMQEMEQLANARGLPTDRNSLNKLMAMHNPGMNIPMNANNTHHNHMGGGRGALGGSAQATFALTNYQTMLMRQNSMSSNPSSSTIQQQPLSCSSSSFVIANPSPSPTFQGSSPLVPVSAQNPSISGLSSSHLSLQRRALSSSSSLLQPSHQQHSGGTNQALQQQMIQQLLQQMSNSNGGAGQQQQSLSGHNMNFNINNGRSGMGSAQNTPVATPIASTSNSFKAVSNNESSSAADSNTTTNNNGFNPSQNLHHSQEGMVPNICHEFSDNGFFSGDLDDNMGYILGRHD